MKKILVFTFAVLLMCACKDKKKNTNDEKTSINTEEETHKELYGFWVGDFIESDSEGFDGDMDASIDKLNINIKRITKDTVFAQSVVSGNLRPLIGKLSDDGKKISLILDEPGNNKYDGRFEMYLDNDTLKGKWKAFNTKLKWPSKEFSLLKKQFVYNANLMLTTDNSYVDWSKWKSVNTYDTLENGKIETYENRAFRSSSDKIFKLNASTVLLKENELKNLKKLDLEIIKNTIFARHGYAFKNQTYRQFFDPVEWYVPVFNNVDKDLTETENTNIKLLDRFIKYATDNYDAFGR